MAMEFGSLFAGIGGFDLGLIRAGMKPAWQVEIDEFCQKVLEKNFPDVERFRDVKEVGKKNLRPVDVVVGGFPCQPHSLAGKRKGAEDDRDLWPEYRRIIEELRPRWVIGENVPGIRTTILDQVLSDLESLDYATRTLIIPACAFDAPHRRERVFIVAHANQDSQSGKPEYERWEISRTMVPNTDAARNGAQGDVRDVTNSEEPGLSHRGQTRTQAIQDEANGRMAQPGLERRSGSWWSVEPDVGRVADGVPNRVDRLRALGNAVVPQVVEWIGRMIVEVDSQFTRD